MANVTRLVPARSSELLDDCQRMAAQLLPGALKTVLDQVDDTFYELANKADNSQRQNLYFDAMRELRMKRESTEESFISTFNSEFENSNDLEKATEKLAMFAPVMELSLVDPDEVGESLALTNFAESIKTKCKDQLFGLDRRMGYLLSEPELTNESNPVGPLIIGNAFKQAFSELDTDIEVKLSLSKIFDKFASYSIYQMYREMNDHLIRRDVLPTIATNARIPSRGAAKTRVIIETEGAQVEANGPDVFSTLQSLMSNTQSHGLHDLIGAPQNTQLFDRQCLLFGSIYLITKRNNRIILQYPFICSPETYTGGIFGGIKMANARTVKKLKNGSAIEVVIKFPANRTIRNQSRVARSQKPNAKRVSK